MPYDWRLPVAQLQKRDGYFSSLRATAELQAELHGERTLLVSHSFGAIVTTGISAVTSASGPCFNSPAG